MSKWDKLINKLYSTNSELRFDEISKILYNLGYEARETKVVVVILPSGRKIKRRLQFQDMEK